MASLSADLGVSDQTIYDWLRQDAVDRCPEPGTTLTEQAELRAARRRVAELETGLAVTKRANELLTAQVMSPRTVLPVPGTMVQVWAVRVCGSASGLPPKLGAQDDRLESMACPGCGVCGRGVGRYGRSRAGGGATRGFL